MRHDLAKLAALIARQRKYAGFFSVGDKASTERKVGEELAASLRKTGLEDLHGLSASPKDPPDLVGFTTTGGRVGIEITEAVSREAIHANAKGRDVYRHWGPGEFSELLAERIADKDAKPYHGGPYERLILCIHTDELEITPERALAEAAATSPVRLKQIHAAYLLLSYHGEDVGYPVFRLAYAA